MLTGPGKIAFLNWLNRKRSVTDEARVPHFLGANLLNLNGSATIPGNWTFIDRTFEYMNFNGGAQREKCR